MFIVLSYDVGVKRVKKVLAVCRKYLRPVHKSVFEGNLTDAQLSRLKRELSKIIDSRHDSICIFKVTAPHFVTKDRLGQTEEHEEII